MEERTMDMDGRWQIRPARPDEGAVTSAGLALAALRGAGVSYISTRHCAAIAAVSQEIVAFLLENAPRTPVELAAKALMGLTPEAVREAARRAGIDLDGETEAE